MMKAMLINYKLWQRCLFCGILVCIHKKIRLQTEKVAAPKSTVVVEKPLGGDPRH